MDGRTELEHLKQELGHTLDSVDAETRPVEETEAQKRQRFEARLVADLRDEATRLAWLKQKADETEEAYQEARKEYEQKFAEANKAVIEAREEAATKYTAATKRTRDMLASLVEISEVSGDVAGGLYTIKTTADELTVADPQVVVDWLVKEAPHLARKLLTLNEKALRNLLIQHSSNENGERVYLPAVEDIPARLVTKRTGQINWSKLK